MPSPRLLASAVAVALAVGPFVLTPPSLAAQQVEPDPESWVVAIGLMERGLHAEAAARFEAFVEAEPRHRRVAEARYRLGVCRAEAGDLDAAIAAFRRALRDDRLELRAECRYRLGQALVESGAAGDAAVAFEALLAEVGEDHYLRVAAAFAAADARRAAGEAERALSGYAAVAAAAGDDPAHAEHRFAALYRGGHLALELDRPADAAARFEAALARFDDHPARGELWHLLAEARWRAGRAEEAVAAWARAVEHGGEFVDDALRGLAWAARTAGDAAAARDLFRRLVERHRASPFVAEARLELGRLALESGDPVAARSAVEPLVADGGDPAQRAAALHVRGRARLDAGDAAGARADLEAARSAGVTAPELALDLGDACLAAGDAEAALGSYELAAVADAATRGDAFYGAAVALHALGRHAESAARAARLVTELPEHRLAALAAFAIAENRYAGEDWPGAAAAYAAAAERFAADDPQRAVCGWKRAWSLFLGGDPGAAIDGFAAAAEADALSPASREEALSMVALAAFEAGDPERALAAADRYAARHRGGEHAARTERVAARVLRARGELAAAAARLERAERAAADGTAVALERADVLLERGDYRGAAAVYRVHREAAGDAGFRALEGLAWCAFELGDDAAALEAAAAGARHPNAGPGAAALDQLAVHVHHRAEDWPRAIAASRAFLDRHAGDPRAPAVRYALGTAAARAGDHAAATAALTAVVAAGRYDRLDLATYELAWACRRGGDEAAAIGWFERLAGMAGADAELVGEARLHVAEHALVAGDSDRARELFAAVDSSHRGRALQRLGQARLAAGELDAAVAAFREVLALGEAEPVRRDALFALGETELERGHAELAREPLAELVGSLDRRDRDERATRARLYWGEALVATGAAADAIGPLEHALAARRDAGERDALAARAALALGRAQVARGDVRAADRAFATAVSRGGGAVAAEARYRRGELAEAGGDLDAAIQAWVQLSILHDDPTWVPRGLAAASRAYAARGDADAAAAFRAELLERFPESEAAAALRRGRRPR